MDGDKKRFFTAVSVLVGTCIGAGVLGIPYVASKSGFFVALFYILFVGGIILLVNLYLGEVSLRTKGDFQIAGYAEKYLGKWGKNLTHFATVFGIYAAIIAYILGVGESFSFLIYGDSSQAVLFGVVFGVFMAGLIYHGMKSLKKFEKIGVLIILSLLSLILILFFWKVSFSNLLSYDFSYLFFPFGVILFALTSFYAVPELQIILHKNEHQLKSVLIAGSFVSVLFYVMFAFVVVGFMGGGTPEIATLALGPIFIFLGIFTMFTSYLSLGNALLEDFMFDSRFSKFTSWIFTAIIPIVLFILIKTFDIFSFTKILSIGGVVSGGIIAVLILLMVPRAKKYGKRKPEYSIPINWFIIFVLGVVFLVGMILQVF